MKRSAFGFALVGLLFSLQLTQNALAQAGAREIRLTALLDYAHAQTDSAGTVIFDGTVDSPVSGRPNLQALGFTEAAAAPLGADERRWNVRGSFATARLIFSETDGGYHLQLGPLELSPEDNLTLILPFVNLDYEQIVPRPDNFSELVRQAATPPNTPPRLFELRYPGAQVNGVALDIPFTPIRKQIALVLTPLVGEMLLNRTPGFRLSGQVRFEGIRDYSEFSWDCPTDPALQAYRYPAAHLLFGLDSLPVVFPAGILSAIYQSKPAYVLVRVDPVSCSFDANAGGRIEATFNGQVYRQHDPAFPAEWVDTLESNQPAEPGSRDYALEMGDIVLAPGDVLTVTMPGVAIFKIDPPPTRTSSTRGQTTEIVYAGPLYSKFKLVYEPEAGLILSQLHTAARSGTREIEQFLGPFWGGSDSAIPSDGRLTWGLGLLAALLFAPSALVRKEKLGRWTEALAWVFAALALFYGLRGVYGLLALAVLIYLKVGADSGRLADYLGRGGIALLLILAAMSLDRFAAANFFTILRRLEIETTPVTPLILFVLGLGLAALWTSPSEQFARLFPRVIPALVLALLPLALFDALQKSLLSLAVMGIGLAYVLHRLKKTSEKMTYGEVLSRFKLAWHSRLIPIGFVVLILFAAQNGLQSTSAVLGPLPGLLRGLLPPVLLIVSILTSFLAMGLLFILLYPILPFDVGYLKAAALGLFLLLTFFLGTGAEEELAATWQTLMIGRLVYYLGVPLLISLVFDITQVDREQPAGAGGEGSSSPARPIAEVAQGYFKDLRALLSTLGSLATLVAPGLYAYFSGVPLLMNYFDLMQTFLTLTAK